MTDEPDVEHMATELAGSIMRAHAEEPVYGSDIVALIRAVIRDEMRLATERAELAQRMATQAHWDWDSFRQQVDALREGRRSPLSESRTARFRSTSDLRQCDNCMKMTMSDGPCTYCGQSQLRQGPTLLRGTSDCLGWCCGGAEDANPNH